MYYDVLVLALFLCYQEIQAVVTCSGSWWFLCQILTSFRHSIKVKVSSSSPSGSRPSSTEGWPRLNTSPLYRYWKHALIHGKDRHSVYVPLKKKRCYHSTCANLIFLEIIVGTFYSMTFKDVLIFSLVSVFIFSLQLNIICI